MEQIAALRAEWLTRLDEAIESAQRVAWQLGTRADTSAEARALYSRLENARIELCSLRGIVAPRIEQADTEWLQKLWSSPLLDAAD